MLRPLADSLVSEDDALNAGTKQHHTGHVWVITDKGKLLRKSSSGRS